MARAKQLRPVDHMTQSLLAEAVRESDVTHADIGEMAGMSQNRVSIILRLETPPATVGEVSAIAHTIGRSGSEFIAAAEAEVASGRHLEGGSGIGSAASPQQHRNDDAMPDWSTMAARVVYDRPERNTVGRPSRQASPISATDEDPDHRHDGTSEEP